MVSLGDHITESRKYAKTIILFGILFSKLLGIVELVNDARKAVASEKCWNER